MPALQKLKTFLESTVCAGGRKPDPGWIIQIRQDDACRQHNTHDGGLFTITHVTLCALKQENSLGVCSQATVNNGMRDRVYHDLIMNEIKFEVYMHQTSRSKSITA